MYGITTPSAKQHGPRARMARLGPGSQLQGDGFVPAEPCCRWSIPGGKQPSPPAGGQGGAQQKACSSGGGLQVPSAPSLGTAGFAVQTRAVPLESNISLSFPFVAERNLSPAGKRAHLGLLLCQQAPCAPTAPHSPHACPVQKHQRSSLAKSTLCRFVLRQCVLIGPIRTGI